MCNPTEPCFKIVPTANTDAALGPTVTSYYELWRFFEDRGGLDKERMITMVTWLLAFAAVVLGYIATNPIVFSGPRACAEQPVQLAIFSAIGVAICLFTTKLINEFATHARSNFIKTDYCKARIFNLDETLKSEFQDDDFDKHGKIRQDVALRVKLRRVGSVFRNFLMITAVVFLIFVVLGTWGIISTFHPPASCVP